VNDVDMGSGASELRLGGSGKVHIQAQVAALLNAEPDEAVRGLPLDRKPYWDLERARIGNSNKVPVELIVNGQSVARQEFVADGQIRPVEFDYTVERSSWVALRILGSSHTNPVFVVVDGKPIRASRESAEWCLKSVEQCRSQKLPHIRLAERGEAERAYDFAASEYRKRIQESYSTSSRP